MAQPAVSSDDSNVPTGSTTVAGLLAMVDYFLSQRPQQVKEAIQCLLASLSLSPPPRVEAKVKLQLGLTLYYHTNNLLEARQALEQAMLISKSIPGVEQVRFEAASILGRIHIEQGYAHNAKKVLKSAMETSHRFPYWHCRLLLQKADIHVYERDIDGLISTLTQAGDYAHQVSAPYTRIMCLLNKGAHLLIHKQYQEAASVLSSCCSLVEEYTGPKATLLKTYYMVIQVTHLLGAGLMKAAKPHLKQLQQCVKILYSEDPSSYSSAGPLTAESFEWFSKEQTYILVYLVCVMHSVLAGHIDKALTFANKALEVLSFSNDSSPVMTVFHAHLLELIVISTIMKGQCTQSGTKLQEVLDICHNHSQLIYSHRAVLHTLLGLYAFATNDNQRCIAQFQTALQHTNSLELQVFINVNLAIVYMKLGPQKEKELQALMEFLQSENVNSMSCKNLKGAVLFLKGLYAFNQLKLHEAKRHLRETFSIANSNDLNKLTVCALAALGQIFLSLGNTKETKDMVDPAFQLSSKIPDKRLQEWTASLFVDLNHLTGSKEAKLSSLKCLQGIQADINKDCQLSTQSGHHSLIKWTVGDWPHFHSEENMETEPNNKVVNTSVPNESIQENDDMDVCEINDIRRDNGLLNPIQPKSSKASSSITSRIDTTILHKTNLHMTPSSLVTPPSTNLTPSNLIPQQPLVYDHVTPPTTVDYTSMPKLVQMTSPTTVPNITSSYTSSKGGHIAIPKVVQINSYSPKVDPLTQLEYSEPPLKTSRTSLDYVPLSKERHSRTDHVIQSSTDKRMSSKSHSADGSTKCNPIVVKDNCVKQQNNIPIDPLIDTGITRQKVSEPKQFTLKQQLAPSGSNFVPPDYLSSSHFHSGHPPSSSPPYLHYQTPFASRQIPQSAHMTPPQSSQSPNPINRSYYAPPLDHRSEPHLQPHPGAYSSVYSTPVSAGYLSYKGPPVFKTKQSDLSNRMYVPSDQQSQRVMLPIAPQQQSINQTAPYSSMYHLSDRLQQYGYAALSPEAVLTQRMQQHHQLQQQHSPFGGGHPNLQRMSQPLSHSGRNLTHMIGNNMGHVGFMQNSPQPQNLSSHLAVPNVRQLYRPNFPH